jgi:hypothetical protein
LLGAVHLPGFYPVTESPRLSGDFGVNETAHPLVTSDATEFGSKFGSNVAAAFRCHRSVA